MDKDALSLAWLAYVGYLQRECGLGVWQALQVANEWADDMEKRLTATYN